MTVAVVGAGLIALIAVAGLPERRRDDIAYDEVAEQS
jgi:hypothetical protein